MPHQTESPPHSMQSRCEDIDQKFRRLAREWKSGRGPLSSAVHMAMHPAYQQIIGMGEPVVPLLLRELQQEPDHWFWALRAITGEDPVPEEFRGNVSRMIDAWLDWGRSRGYVSARET